MIFREATPSMRPKILSSVVKEMKPKTCLDRKCLNAMYREMVNLNFLLILVVNLKNCSGKVLTILCKLF